MRDLQLFVILGNRKTLGNKKTKPKDQNKGGTQS